MSYQRFFDAMRVQAASLDSYQGQPRWGTIVTTDPTTHRVQVMIQPENILSGWLPMLTPSVGGGWGLVMPPVAGQQVFIVPDNGDHEHGVVVGAGYSDANMPPTTPATPGAQPNPAQAGEIALVHQSGSYIRLNNDGSVFLNTAQDLNVKVGGNVSASIQGNLTATISGNASATITGTLSADALGMVTLSSATSVKISAPSIELDSVYVTGQADGASPLRLATEEFVNSTYASHSHSGIQSGSSNTGPPVIPPTAADLTTNMRAS